MPRSSATRNEVPSRGKTRVQPSADRQEQTDLTAKVISTLRSPLAPAAPALPLDARGHERERLMGRIPRPTVGTLKNSITGTVSKPPAPAAAAKSKKTVTRATGSWLAPAVPARASRALRRPGERPRRLQRSRRWPAPACGRCRGTPAPASRAQRTGTHWRERTLEALLAQRPLACRPSEAASREGERSEKAANQNPKRAPAWPPTSARQSPTFADLNPSSSQSGRRHPFLVNLIARDHRVTPRSRGSPP